MKNIEEKQIKKIKGNVRQNSMQCMFIEVYGHCLLIYLHCVFCLHEECLTLIGRNRLPYIDSAARAGLTKRQRHG